MRIPRSGCRCRTVKDGLIKHPIRIDGCCVVCNQRVLETLAGRLEECCGHGDCQDCEAA